MKFGQFPFILFIAMCLGGCASGVKPPTPPASARTISNPPAPPSGTGALSKRTIIGMDARWNEYGEYLNELIKIVQAQWYKILNESRASPPRATTVTVKFRLNSQGEVEILRVDDAGAGKQGVSCCINAITSPMPYRKWTDPMIAALGNSQELTFSFYYQ